jgi:hypothetical protein
MDKQKLKESLLNRRTKLYCILDGAAVKDLPKKLYETRPPKYSLIRGKLTPDMIHVAPYLVQLLPNGHFTKWVLDEGFGKNWGIFVHCRFSITEMRRHFRALISVHDETGKPLIFRFYDPRVIRKFLPTCEPNQIKTFFGKVETFFVEAENEEKLITYEFENNGLKQGEIDLADKE